MDFQFHNIADEPNHQPSAASHQHCRFIFRCDMCMHFLFSLYPDVINRTQRMILLGRFNAYAHRTHHKHSRPNTCAASRCVLVHAASALRAHQPDHPSLIVRRYVYPGEAFCVEITYLNEPLKWLFTRFFKLHIHQGHSVYGINLFYFFF